MAGGVEAGGAGEADARVRAGATEEESANGSGVTGKTEKRAHGEELVESKFPVGDVAAGEAVIVFEIERSDNAPGEDFGGKVGRVFGEGLDDGVGEGVALGRPI